MAGTPSLLNVLLSLTDDPDPMVRFQLAFRLGEVASDRRAIAALTSIAERDANSPWTRVAVLSSIAGRPIELLDGVASRPGFLSGAEGPAWLDHLGYQVGVERNSDQLRRFIDQLEHPGLGSASMMRAILALSRGLERGGGSLSVLIRQGGDSSKRLSAIVAEASDLVHSDATAENRIVAIQLLAAGDPPKARESLFDLLDARQPTAVQLGVLQSLGGIMDRSVAQHLIKRWKSMSPTVRRESIEVLLSRREAVLMLIEAIGRREIPGSEVEASRLNQLRNYPDQAVRDRAREIIATEAIPSRGRVEMVAAFQPSLNLVGRRDSGRDVFLKVCATCHQAEELGVEVGPNMATVANRSAEDLIVHILDPNREVAANYVNYSLATTSGRVLSGIIIEESANALVLRRAEGASDIVPRDQIESVTSTGISLMPEGLEKGLSHQDLADLIAFLRSIRPEKSATVRPRSIGR